MSQSDAHDGPPGVDEMFAAGDIRPFLDGLTRRVRGGMPERDPDDPPRTNEPMAMTRTEALRTVRRYLSTKPAGWQFRARDLYEEICAATQRSPTWVRVELAGTLTAEGLVQRDLLDGTYTTTARARQVTDHGDLPGQPQ